MKTRNLLTLIIATATLSACAEQDLQLLDSTASHQATVDPMRIEYLTEVNERPQFDHEAGPVSVPVAIERDTPFQGVSVMLTSPAAEVYYRTTAHDVWTRMQADEQQAEGFASGYISLRFPTDQIELWSPDPMSFGRLELHDVPVGQALPLDDEPGYADETDEEEPAIEQGEDGVRRQALAQPGRWQLSAEAYAAGQEAYLSYDPPGAWNSGRVCTGGLREGARKLGEFLVRKFEGARYFGGYNCRKVRGGSGTSVHAVGRALDVFVPLSGGRADNDLGDEIANYLVAHAEELGVQFVIWDRTKWNASYSGSKARYYGGEHPHHDHLHIELTREAAGGPPGRYPEAAPLVFDAPFADDDNNTHVKAIEALYDAGITGGCADRPLRYCPSRDVSRANTAVMLQRALRLSSVEGDFFDDDDGLGAEAAINSLAAREIIKGCDADSRKFCPADSVTRGALVVMLDRGLQLADTTKDYFVDDDGTYFEAAANRVAAAGLTTGCSDQRFCGGDTVQRDQLASFIARVVGLLPGFDPQPLAYRGEFADDDGHLFEGDIDKVARAGIVRGCEQGDTPRFCPEDPATRAQTATFLVRAFDIPASNHDAFSDDNGTTHEDNINAIAAANVTSGCGDGIFCPGREVSRGEVAVFLNRANRLPATSQDFFDDDDGMFYEDAANRLAAAGFTSGCSERKFCGGRAVSRGEMAAFLARILRL